MNVADLPEDVRARLSARTAADVERRRQFELAIAAKRDEAVKGRKASGIEDVWLECEEAYLGIDDENRAEFAGAKWAKPTTMDGGLIRKGNSSDGVKSTAFVRLTSRYVDAGAAKVGEITQPVDDKPFSLKATPVPELIAGKDDLRQILHGGQPVLRDPNEEELQAGQQGPQPLRVKDLAQHRLAVAEDAAEKAETRIYDWMVEGGHAAEMRKVIFDASRLGAGCLKGPVPTQSKAQVVTHVDGAIVVQLARSIVPATRWVDLWNLFPDPACGENIHDGSYLFERDFFSRARLIALKNQPGMGYDDAAIDRVLVEGPNKINTEEGLNPAAVTDGRTDKQQFTVWYFYGEITRQELALAGGEPADDESQESVFAIITMVNDTAIRTVLNPLDSGSFPYHVVAWRRRAGHWAGVGVAEQVRLPQRGVNAATRALLNNAGVSAGPQLVIDRGAIVPGDGNWTVTPNKLWWKGKEASIDDVKKAFGIFEIPNHTPQLMQVIEYFFKLAEESSNIPLITQGQSGKTTPDTLGGQVLQNNNANQLLRDVGFAFADSITDPLVRQFYEWLLLDPDVPDDEKGDFKVDCSASIAMIERAIQDQAIMQMGAMVANPAFGIDPKKWFAQMARTKRLDPRDFQYTPEEQEQLDKRPPPPPPQIAAAQIRAASAERIAQHRDETSVQKMKLDSDRDTIYAQTEAERARATAEAKLEELRLKRELAQLDYQARLIEFATQRGITLDKAKTDLAKTAMELKVQKELAGADGKAEQVAPTDMEPVGQAPDGEAFQR